MSRWLQRPYLFFFPVVAVLAAIALALSVQRRQDGPPFVMVAFFFLAAYCTLAISFWPYIIPFAVTIEQAAAPHSSLAFMFWFAGIIVFPLMLIYTAVGLSAFRGKVSRAADHY
jgi:cytochrome d ubiquinol oxidase subunit II